MEDGSPAAFRRYSIKTPDGNTVSGLLDADGRVRLDDLTPGNCDVGFPEIDGSEWSGS